MQDSFDTQGIAQLLDKLNNLQIRIGLDEQGGLRVRSQQAIPDAIIEALREQKPALIAWLQQQKLSTIQPVDNSQPTALSSQQLRLWYLCQSDNTAAYHIGAAFIVKGGLHLSQLERALHALAQRHPILNAQFFECEGKVWQQAVQHRPSIQSDTLAISATDKESLADFSQQRLGQTFTLANSPLWRVECYGLAEADQHLLLLNMHHLISDGWSNQILLQDFLQALSAPLEKPATDYFAYAAWQNQQIENNAFQTDVDFWQEQLAAIQPLELSHSSKQTALWQQHTFAVGLNTQQINDFTQQQGISRFALYFSAWAIVLHKLSRQTQFAILSPDANRRMPQLQDCVGFIANTLALPVHITEHTSLVEFCRQTHQLLQQSQTHADAPFEQVLQQASIANSEQIKALFEAAIHYLPEAPSTQWALGDLSIEALNISEAQGKYPISLNIEGGEQGRLWISFNAAEFEPAFVQHIARYYQRVLSYLLQQGNLSIADCPLLSKDEQRCLLALSESHDADSVFHAIAAANKTTQDWPSDSILHLIEQQVLATPQAIAVSDSTQQLSYQTLWQQSAEWAGWLNKNLGTGQIIAVCLERSVQVSTVLLGILRSGNAYMPLDSQAPQQRLAYQLEHSQAALLITQESLSSRFEDLSIQQVLAAKAPPTIDICSNASEQSDGSLFALIYTSGSTGTPKGVRILHDGIANRLQWMQQQYVLTPKDTVLQKTPLTFDVSIWELFLPIMTGSRLHFAPPTAHQDALWLGQIIQQEQISVLHFVPSMLRLFLQSHKTPQPNKLRLLFSSGEALTSDLALQAQDYWPQASLHNLYGPTEASVDVSYFSCSESFSTATVPIGKAIANTQLHILDEQLGPVAPFCAGEIIIGGANLAEGYHQQSALTAAAFIDNPYSAAGHPSAKLYRSGDIGRFLADGSIEYLGRKDDQIKLRGLRVELGEIETAAMQHADITQAVAIVVEENPEQSLLLFYSAPQPLELKTLRAFLQQQLALNIMPNHFVHQPAIPLSSSGKTDKKQLIDQWKATVKPQTINEPLSEIEQTVKAIWQAYFSNIALSREDNFFELGGHSLMAGRIVAQLAEHFHCDLRFVDMLQHPTIAQMAQWISQQQKLSVSPMKLADKIPASSQQKRLYLFQQWQPESSAYHMPVLLKVEGQLNIAHLQRAFLQLVKNQAILRTVYYQEDESIYQAIRADHHWQLDYQTASAAQSEKLISALLQKPFDLQKDLPLRALLIKQDEQQYCLAMVLHHIAGDAKSLEIIAQELIKHYQNQSEESTPAKLQYAHYAQWQNQQDSSKALSYWQQELHDAPELLALPHDFSRPKLQSFAGKTLNFSLSKTLSEQINRFCQQEQITPFLLLLSVYQLLLAKLSQQGDVAIALAVSGRHQADWQDAIGFFVNTLIIRSRQESNPQFRVFLQRQKQLLEQALAHQDVALEEVLQSLNRLRNTAHTPIAQVGFNFLQEEKPLAALQLDDIHIQPMDSEGYSSKSDMLWIFYPQQDQYHCTIEFNHQLFKSETIQQWFSHFEHLLQSALQQPDTAIHNLEAISESYIKQQLQLGAEQSVLALTPMQRDIYLDSVLRPQQKRNHIGYFSSVQAPIDIALWQQTLQHLYQYNDVLRSSIHTLPNSGGQWPVQVIAAADTALPAHCFQFFDHQQDYDAALQPQLVDQCVHQQWDLSKVLWRVHIHRFNYQQHVIIAGFHHSVFDGVSIQIVGRLMKDNYQRLLAGKQPIEPRNDYANYAKEQILKTDSESAWLYWQEAAKNVASLPPLRPEGSIEEQVHLHYLCAEAEEQQLKQFCRQHAITPALYFKSVFAVCAQYYQNTQHDTLIFEVVTGRNAKNYDVIGLLFDQQPNVLSAKVTAANKSFADVFAWFKQQRKAVAAHTPISLRWQQRLFPQNRVFLYNYYIMETASSFLGKQEAIEHIIPQLEQTVNLVCQVKDNKTQLHLFANQADIHVASFRSIFLRTHRRLLEGDSTLAALFANEGLANNLAEMELVDIYGQASLPNVPGFLKAKGEEQSAKTAVYDGEKLHLLQQAAIEQTAESEKSIAPRNTLEQQLADVWQEVLGASDISIHDNFFDLGGHSLSAMRIANRLQEHYGLSLPMAAVFNEPTIAAIAQFMVENPSQMHSISRIEKAPPADAWPLSYAQQRLYLLSLIQNDSSYNVPIALHIRGALNTQALQQALQQLWQRHEVLSTRIIQQGEQVRWASADSFQLEHVQQSPGTVDAYCKAQALQPFAIENEALSRMQLIYVAENHYVLLLVLHHVICDARSLEILASELWQNYQAIDQGRSLYLPEPSLSYHDYCVWQQQIADNDVLRQQLHYWQEELRDAPLMLGLPLDKPRSLIATNSAAQYNFNLPSSIKEALEALAKAQGISLFMLMLTVYQILLSRRCQQKDVCIGIPQESRPDSRLENTIGFFINALVIRNDYSANLSLAEALQAVRDKSLKAFANQLVPAEKVLQSLNLPRSLSYTPIVQAAFNFLKADSSAMLTLEGLQLELMDLAPSVAKFELLLTIVESDNQLQANFEYNSDLFEHVSIVNLASQFSYLLEQISQPDITHIHQLALDRVEQEYLPLTAMQQDLYLASISQPDTLENSIGYALHLPIALDVERWQQVHQACSEHYKMLRARLHKGSYWLLDKPVTIQELDWSNKNYSATQLESALRALVVQSYDVTTDDLLRLYLVKLDDKSWYTVLACHHLLLDGMSFTLHAYHMVTNYFNLQEGNDVVFAADNYAGFVAHQQKNANLKDNIAYWQTQLQSIEPLQVQNRGNDNSIRLSHLPLSQEHWQHIKSYCRQQRITPAIYFKALYALMIQYYCQPEADFVLFDYHDGRGRQFMRSMGCHYQRQLLKVDISTLTGDIKALFDAFKTQQKQQQNRHNLSLQAQTRLLPKENANFSFNYLYMPKSGSTHGVDFAGISYSPDFANNTDLRVQEDQGELKLTLCFQESVLQPLDFLQRLHSLSEQVLAGIENTQELSYLLKREKNVCALISHDAPTNVGTILNHDLLHTALSKQAQKTPNNTAIICGNKTLSYAELETQSNQLANYLVAQGIKKGDRIGICLSRRPEVFIAFIAVIKAGAIYIPMDANYPSERLAYMANDASMRMVISENALLNKFIEVEHIVSIDNIVFSEYSAETPNIDIQGDDILYMIYTSGSTGLPKAAQVYQQSFANLLAWYIAEYDLSAKDKALIISAFGFDLTQKNLFALLCCGGTVVLPESDYYDVEHYRRTIWQQEISILNCAPSAFYPMVELATDEQLNNLASLRLLLFGGESINLNNLQHWIQSPSFKASLVNMYGPTECTDIATAFSLTAEDVQQWPNDKAIPIGQPIPGVSLYVLNEQLQAVPQGLPGELYIAGSSVGAGYWQRPEMNAESFIANPYSQNNSDTVLYKTGDRVINKNGELYYLGRKDFQVKLNGLRIELGEIEQAIKQLGEDIDSYVLVDNEQLLAFVRCEEMPDNAIATLQAQLPAYMLPKSLIRVDSWPLNAHGKIDRNALLALERPTESSTSVAPRTETEQQLAALWQEVLGDSVGIHDNFFGAGGDSIAAVRLVTRIELFFSIKIPVSSLFNAQTIAQLALLIDQQTGAWSPIVPIQPQGHKTPIFAVHAIGAMVMSYKDLAQSLGTEQPFYGIQALGFEEGQEPFTALNEMVAYYTAAIKQQQPEGPYRLIGHSFGGLIAAEIARQLLAIGDEVEQLVLLDTHMPVKYMGNFADDAAMLKAFAEHNFGVVDVPLRVLRKLPQDKMIDIVAEQFKGTVSADFIHRAISIIKGFQQMMQSYKPQLLATPITLIRPKQQSAVQKLANISQGKSNKTLGWDKITQQLTVKITAGDHHSMLQGDNANALAKTLKNILDKE